MAASQPAGQRQLDVVGDCSFPGEEDRPVRLDGRRSGCFFSLFHREATPPAPALQPSGDCLRKCKACLPPLLECCLQAAGPPLLGRCPAWTASSCCRNCLAAQQVRAVHLQFGGKRMVVVKPFRSGLGV